MASTRRSLLAAATAFALPALAPFAADGRERRGQAKGCRGREAYAGEGLRPQLYPAVFDAAEASAKARPHMVIHEELDEAFDKAAAAMKASALCAAVITPDGGQWNQLRVPRGEAEPSRFLWAGLAETCTATAILQLVEEGKLGLEDRLDRWSPETPSAAFIKIDDLLSHTSGLGGPGAAAFCPGANWARSAAGYAALDRIIEASDGAPRQEALTRRVVERLGLEETTILGAGQAPDGLAVSTPETLAAAQSTGAVAASALDVVRLWRGLMANRLHGRAITRGRFYRLYPMAGVGPGYCGQGVTVSDLWKTDPKARDTWLGQGGELPGGRAMLAYSVQKNAYAAVALKGEGAPEAVAKLLFAGLPDAKAA